MDFLGGRRRVGRPLKLYIEYSKKERLARVGRPLKLNTLRILSRGGKSVSSRQGVANPFSNGNKV